MRMPASAHSRLRLLLAELDPQMSAVVALNDALQRIVGHMQFIENPIMAAVSQAVSASSALGPEAHARSKKKLGALFGGLLSSTEMVKAQLLPIINAIEPYREGEKRMTKEIARVFFEDVKHALPMIRSGLSEVNSKAHMEALQAESVKQTKALITFQAMIDEGKASGPQAQRAIEAARQYTENITAMAGAEFADRIENNVNRAMNQGVPNLIRAVANLGISFGARQKAASVRNLQKRLRVVSKRIVLLAYLTSESSDSGN